MPRKSIENMRIPFWKKWLSHFTPLLLEQAASDQNPELSVMLDRGRVQLLSGDAIYSWDDLYHNFDLAFEQLALDKRAYENVLLLGLGLGSVPLLLEKKYAQKYYYTAIEWDETITEMALRYTLSRLDSPIDIVTADAEVFVDVCEETFDLVIVDIFEDEITPPQFETPEFLQACDKLLAPGGLLMFNRLYAGNGNKTITERFFERHFKPLFPEAWYFDTGGNWILCYEKINLPLGATTKND